MKNKTLLRKVQRQKRTRAKVQGTAQRPRLSVYRSNTSIAVQLIDDVKKHTLLGLRESKKNTGSKSERAKTLGVDLAKQALEKKIKTVVFDKGSYAYHGRVKALAEGVREGGLQF